MTYNVFSGTLNPTQSITNRPNSVVHKALFTIIASCTTEL